MWVHISQTLKKRSYNFQQNVQDVYILKTLKQLIQNYYPSLYPYIQHQYIQDSVVLIQVQEPVVLLELNTQKQLLKNALKQKNIQVKDIKFII